MQAVSIIAQEHRSLAAVLRALLYVVRETRYFAIEPHFELLDAMLHYIDAFSEQFHHPKEETYLFERLGARLPAAAPLINRLKHEHQSGTVKLRALQDALMHYREAAYSAFPEFSLRAAEFAVFHWEHMRLEEDELIPLARLHLTGADWDAIDAAFLGHTDPLLGAEGGVEYQELFRRIVELAPAPLGKVASR